MIAAECYLNDIYWNNDIWRRASLNWIFNVEKVEGGKKYKSRDSIMPEKGCMKQSSPVRKEKWT